MGGFNRYQSIQKTRKIIQRSDKAKPIMNLSASAKGKPYRKPDEEAK